MRQRHYSGHLNFKRLQVINKKWVEIQFHGTSNVQKKCFHPHAPKTARVNLGFILAVFQNFYNIYC